MICTMFYGNIGEHMLGFKLTVQQRKDPYPWPYGTAQMAKVPVA